MRQWELGEETLTPKCMPVNPATVNTCVPTLCRRILYLSSDAGSSIIHDWSHSMCRDSTKPGLWTVAKVTCKLLSGKVSMFLDAISCSLNLKYTSSVCCRVIEKISTIYYFYWGTISLNTIPVKSRWVPAHGSEPQFLSIKVAEVALPTYQRDNTEDCCRLEKIISICLWMLLLYILN